MSHITNRIYFSSILFQEDISACATVHTRYVMDACDCVRSIFFASYGVDVKKAEWQWVQALSNLTT